MKANNPNTMPGALAMATGMRFTVFLANLLKDFRRITL